MSEGGDCREAGEEGGDREAWLERQVEHFRSDQKRILCAVIFALVCRFPPFFALVCRFPPFLAKIGRVCFCTFVPFCAATRSCRICMLADTILGRRWGGRTVRPSSFLSCAYCSCVFTLSLSTGSLHVHRRPQLSQVFRSLFAPLGIDFKWSQLPNRPEALQYTVLLAPESPCCFRINLLPLGRFETGPLV